MRLDFNFHEYAIIIKLPFLIGLSCEFHKFRFNDECTSESVKKAQWLRDHCHPTSFRGWEGEGKGVFKIFFSFLPGSCPD